MSGNKTYCTEQLDNISLNAGGGGAKAARLGDAGSGHGCFPPTPIISGSPDIIINGRPAARVGDALVDHGCGDCPPHPRSISAGSGTVIFNGKPAARTGDAIDCGGTIIGGSGDVIIGDQGLQVADQPCLEAAKAAGSALVQTYPNKPPQPEKGNPCLPCELENLSGAQQQEAPLVKPPED